MVMKDRLIELLSNAPADYDGNRNVRTLADYLLANGVIVPPCKVGDTVYFVYGGLINPHEIKRFEMDEYGNFAFSSLLFTFDEFGKTVFLTREAAEQAIKRGVWK